jgi:hypothetical protein
MPDKKQQPAKETGAPASRRFLDRFDRLVLEHQSDARSLTRDYFLHQQEIKRRYDEEVAEAFRGETTDDVQDALNRANERYAEALGKAQDEANAAADGAFRAYVARLRDVWAESDVEGCDVANLSAAAESMLIVAGRASGTLPS